ncbi:anaerobic sulfatase maturase [Vibrio sp. FNV 38]|nr:anaerobic sulfatase maturase [Vibrio sp. FNV 38]
MQKVSMKDSTLIQLSSLKTANKDLSNNPKYQRRFHVMAKPGGSKCNIDCQYCFYLHKEGLLHQPKQPRMDDETLERFIESYIESHDGNEIVFSWQGGEPTMLGVDYYRKIVTLQQKYQPAGVTIQNDLQTNGLLLNEEWCEFLKQHHFLVGLSIDGPRELHDVYRVTRSGKPTFDRVMKAAQLLKSHNVPFNALTVVNNENVKHPLVVYRFLTQELGATYVQFTPCVEAAEFTDTAPQFWNDKSSSVRSDINLTMNTRTEYSTHSDNVIFSTQNDSLVTDWSVSPKDWGDFLITVFEEWINNDLGKVLVNYFETAVAQKMGLPSQMCTTAEFCGKGIAIEHNGDVYSCDHYVYPEYQLGSINDHKLNNLVFSTRQEAFGMAKRDSLPSQCNRCDHLTLCWGGCPKDRLAKTNDGEQGLNYLCTGFKAFYNYADPILNGLVALIQRNNSNS